MIDIEALTKDGANVEHYRKGNVIINDGEPADDRMYIILDGTVDVYKNYGRQGELNIAVLSPGDFFGEMSLFLNKGRTATIVAGEDVTVSVTDREGIFEYLGNHPEAAFSFIQTLCMRLDSTNVHSADSRVRYEKDLTILNHKKTVLETTANTDPLTGIFNRRYFINHVLSLVDAAARMNQDAFIVLLDLDHFKKVNDTYGHSAGDVVLKRVANTISSSVRSGDILARYGGEEFIVLITCACKEDALALVERIRQNIRKMTVEYENAAINITTSAGIASITPECSISETVSLADQALYKAKNEGRNRTVFYEER
jgi:diguanylate cyclase (GGDEF)-like protein